MPIPQKKPKRLKRFRLNEISSVDKPAMENALIALIKRDGTDYQQALEYCKAQDFEVSRTVADERYIIAKDKHGRKHHIEYDGEAKTSKLSQYTLREPTAEEIKANTAIGLAALARETQKVHDYINGKDTSMSKNDDDPHVTFAKARTDFHKRVEEIRARDKCRHTVAMSKARVEFPDEFDAMVKANSEANNFNKADDRPAPNKDYATFMQKVSEIATRNKIPRTQAMAKARALYPVEFAKAYSFEQ